MHPLLACVHDLAAALDKATGADPDWLGPAEKGDLLLALARVGERVAALRLRVLAGADDLAGDTGARSAAAWLAHHTRVGPAGSPTTDHTNLAFLCTYHHHRAHDPAYTHTWHHDAITYHRRT